MSDARETIASPDLLPACRELIAARQTQQLTQNDLAKALGVSTRTVMRLEAGDPGVGLGTLVAAARVLRLTFQLVPRTEGVRVIPRRRGTD